MEKITGRDVFVLAAMTMMGTLLLVPLIGIACVTIGIRRLATG